MDAGKHVKVRKEEIPVNSWSLHGPPLDTSNPLNVSVGERDGQKRTQREESREDSRGLALGPLPGLGQIRHFLVSKDVISALTHES